MFPGRGNRDVPFLYVYNADNPPEGTIAKRRGYAVLVDYMQTVLAGQRAVWGTRRTGAPARPVPDGKERPGPGHALQHLIIDAVTAANLNKDMHLTHDLPLADVVSTGTRDALKNPEHADRDRDAHPRRTPGRGKTGRIYLLYPPVRSRRWIAPPRHCRGVWP